MGLVRTWTRQLVRAAGASLIAPLVLLLAAGVVASAGGAGSFSSLGEIASGPSLPDVGLSEPPGSALEDAEIVGVDLSPPPDVSRPAAPPPDALASAPPTPTAQRPPAPVGPPPAVNPPPVPIPPQAPDLSEPPATGNDGTQAPAPPPAEPAPGAPQPIQNLLDTTRDIGDTLRTPLEPLTNALLELLLGPPPRGSAP